MARSAIRTVLPVAALLAVQPAGADVIAGRTFSGPLLDGQLTLQFSASDVGFVLLPGGRRRLPEANVRRFRNRLRGMRDRWRLGISARR